MALGIYLNFFNYFEEEVHELDIIMAAEVINIRNNYTDVCSEEYQVFLKEHEQLSTLQSEILHLDEKLEWLDDVALMAVINNSDDVVDIECLYEAEIELINTEKDKKTVQNNSIMHEHSLKKGKGPCTKLIETVLRSLKVQRQAYHGKSFVGNHVHKMLKKSSILKLCNSVPKFVYDQGLSGTHVHQRAIDISTKYKKLFDKFAQCYNIFASKSTMTADTLRLLQKAIDDLMIFFCDTWPDASVTPKLHMLESRAVLFLQKWGGGAGFGYGEQGGESIHMEFNKLTTVYKSIPYPSMKLKSILKSHHQKTDPENIKLRPRLYKRKKL
ncbi:uncharacterized protein LOC136079755 [Hydra vulgaris]|uniref:Uncharacterized protein LOC136079755 n=1 Tax=Hydra vulgaris TaxID=6087 RepID=A0ABM4BSK6_HYDVU